MEESVAEPTTALATCPSRRHALPTFALATIPLVGVGAVNSLGNSGKVWVSRPNSGGQD